MPETITIPRDDLSETGPHSDPHLLEKQGEQLHDMDVIAHGLGVVAMSEQVAEARSLTDLAEEVRLGREHTGRARANGEIADRSVEYYVGMPFAAYGSEIRTAVRDGGYSSAELSAVIKEASAASAYIKNIDNEQSKGEAIIYPDYAGSIITDAPDEIVRRAYSSSLDRESGAIKHWLGDKLGPNSNIEDALAASKFLSRIYGETPATIRQNEAAMKDPMVRKFVDGKDFFKLVLAEVPNQPESGETNKAFSDRMQLEVKNTLMRQVGLSAELSDDYLRAIYERTRIKNEDGFTLRGEGAGVDVSKVKEALGESLANIKAVGVESIALIRETCGIRNYDNYTASQLQRMVRFVNGDPKELEHLRAGDVTVLLGDGSGDHNHANKTSAKDFDTESGRTLFFEINRPSDFYRHMKSMKDKDVAPSTLVWVAHGSPGAMFVGDRSDASEFIISNHDVATSKENSKLYRRTVVSLDEAKGLRRVATEYMRPSRGIDDNEAAVGRRRIILKSCSQSKERPTFRTQEDGQSYWVDESTVETIAKTIGDPNVDVYGASEVAAVKPTEKGFEYLDRSDKKEKAEKPLAATKVSVDANGKIHRERVTEVVLRK